MEEDFNYLFYYLEKEGISIDKSEFLFQIKSHPDYPSLLSISDTLSFFNINNNAIKVDYSEIELLPNSFVTLLKNDYNNQQLCHVEKINKEYRLFINDEIIKVSFSELKERWKGIVLLIEESILSNYKSKNHYNWILPFLCMFLFLTTIYIIKVDLTTKMFFIFPIIGFIFSIAALKDLFGAKSQFINKFCNMSSATNCGTVIDSDKWIIFKYLNLSDISIIYFSFQFIGLFISLLVKKNIEYFNIQGFGLIMSLPIILLSIYYQKFIVKKWCPICLAIVFTIVAELAYVLALKKISYYITFQVIILFGFGFIFSAITWFFFKRILRELKELKEFQIRANRFLRNYQIFKNSLTSKAKIELPFTHISLGNKESKIKITLITNPFCSHCKETHEIIERLLDKYIENIQVKIIIKANLEAESNEVKLFFRRLMLIYLEGGDELFRNAFTKWFLYKNIKKWLSEHLFEETNTKKIDATYNLQNDWCITNNFNYTPAIFINGYLYPDAYERKNLELYMVELLEDKNI